MTKKTMIAALVSAHEAHAHLKKTNPESEHVAIWERRIEQLEKLLPSGSGIDRGTIVEHVSPEKLVLNCAFHHMDEHGYYCGWTEHRLTFKPRLDGFLNVSVSGRDKNDIKDYLADTYLHALQEDAPELDLSPIGVVPELTWHVVTSQGGRVLAVFGEALLSHAQDEARKVEGTTGFPAFVVQVKGNKPGMGSTIEIKVPS